MSKDGNVRVGRESVDEGGVSQGVVHFRLFVHID